MKKYTFSYQIGNYYYVSDLLYPLTIIDKSLDESLSLFSFSMYSNLSEPDLTNQEAILRIYEDDIEIKTYDLILLSDIVEKSLNNHSHLHKITLIEYLYILDQYLMPNLTITRIRGEYEPTLYDVLSRILNIAKQEFQIDIKVQPDLMLKLSEVESPEWTFTNYTLLEIIRKILGFVFVIPSMDVKNKLSFKKLSGAAEFAAPSSENITKNPERDKTALKTNAKNMITNHTVFEPSATTFGNVRSPDRRRITADSAYIPTAFPIYDVVDVKLPISMRVEKLPWYGTEDERSKWVFIEVDSADVAGAPDWRDWVVEKQVYDNLPLTTNIGGQGATLYYTQGEKGIYGLGNRAPSIISWVPNAQAWRVILDKFAKQPNSVITDQVKLEKMNYYINKINEAWQEKYSENAPTAIGDARYNMWMTDTPEQWGADPYRLQDIKDNPTVFKPRIEYMPYVESDLYTYKENMIKGRGQLLNTYQNYNQQENTTSAQSLAKLHDKIIMSNVGMQKEIDLDFESLSAAPKTGQRVGDYMVSSVVSDIMFGSVRARYQLDEYMTKLNEHVAVLEKRRESVIPTENIVRSQRTIHRFLRFSKNPRTIDDGSNINLKEVMEGEPNRLAKLEGQNQTVHWAVNSYPFNNSLVFDFEAPSHGYVGLKAHHKEGTVFEDEPMPIYEDKVNLWNGKRPLRIFREVSNWDIDNYLTWPEFGGLAGPGIFYNSAFDVDFDARELMAFSLQLHFVDETGKVRISPHLANTSKLVSGPGYNDLVLVYYNEPHDEFIPDEKVSAWFTGYALEEFNLYSYRIRPQLIAPQTSAKYYALATKGTNGFNILFSVEEDILANQVPENLYLTIEKKI